MFVDDPWNGVPQLNKLAKYAAIRNAYVATDVLKNDTLVL